MMQPLDLLLDIFKLLISATVQELGLPKSLGTRLTCRVFASEIHDAIITTKVIEDIVQDREAIRSAPVRIPIHPHSSEDHPGRPLHMAKWRLCGFCPSKAPIPPDPKPNRTIVDILKEAMRKEARMKEETEASQQTHNAYGGVEDEAG
ncbi:ankyrin [Apiospora saccharicola]